MGTKKKKKKTYMQPLKKRISHTLHMLHASSFIAHFDHKNSSSPFPAPFGSRLVVGVASATINCDSRSDTLINTRCTFNFSAANCANALRMWFELPNTSSSGCCTGGKLDPQDPAVGTGVVDNAGAVLDSPGWAASSVKTALLDTQESKYDDPDGPDCVRGDGSGWKYR